MIEQIELQICTQSFAMEKLYCGVCSNNLCVDEARITPKPKAPKAPRALCNLTPRRPPRGCNIYLYRANGCFAPERERAAKKLPYLEKSIVCEVFFASGGSRRFAVIYEVFVKSTNTLVGT